MKDEMIALLEDKYWYKMMFKLVIKSVDPF